MKQYELTYEKASPRMIQDGPFKEHIIFTEVIESLRPIEDNEVTESIIVDTYDGLGTKGLRIIR